jgi:hypothetical protein
MTAVPAYLTASVLSCLEPGAVRRQLQSGLGATTKREGNRAVAITFA